MGSLAFKLHFSIICHTKGIMSVSYKTQKAAGPVGGLHLMWRAPGLGGAQKLHFHSSGFLFVDAASPAGQDLLEKLWAGKRARKPRAGEGRDRCHPNTPAGTSLSPETAGIAAPGLIPKHLLLGIRESHVNVDLTQKSIRAIGC